MNKRQVYKESNNHGWITRKDDQVNAGKHKDDEKASREAT